MSLINSNYSTQQTRVEDSVKHLGKHLNKSEDYCDQWLQDSMVKIISGLTMEMMMMMMMMSDGGDDENYLKPDD